MRGSLAAVCSLLALGVCSCTIRYSQSLTDRIVRVQNQPLQNSDSAIEVGFGLFGGEPSTIAFGEPMAADELLKLPCEVAFTQVDYRAIYYAYYIAIKIPEVRTTSYCIPMQPNPTPQPQAP